MTATLPLPRPALDAAPLELAAADLPPFRRSLAEVEADLADNATQARRLLEQLAGTRRALAIVETRRRRLLEARARSTAAIDLEQLLEV